MNLPEPHLAERNQSPPKKRGWLVWLKNTEVWKRFVTRARGGPYVIIVAVVFMLIQIGLKMQTPILKLEQLEQHSGMLLEVGYSGKYNQRGWIVLRQFNGETLGYKAVSTYVLSLQSLTGKVVTIYSRKEICLLCFDYENMLEEVEYEGKAQLHYNYAERLWRQQHRWELFGIYFILGIPALLIIFALFLLWHAAKLPTPPTLPTDPSSKEKPLG